MKILTSTQVQELGSLLISWEDGNISDYEYCNRVGEILGYGNWTYKEYRKEEEE